MDLRLIIYHGTENDIILVLLQPFDHGAGVGLIEMKGDMLVFVNIKERPHHMRNIVVGEGKNISDINVPLAVGNFFHLVLCNVHFI